MQQSKDIEIKIWAEINGFLEISDGVGDKSLLMPSELREYKVEGLNSLNSDAGFCSIFYATNSYVLGYHFLAKDRYKLLERRDTVVAVVIRRGFKFTHPFAALSQLRKNYEAVLGNQNKSKGKREVGFDTLQKLSSWETELAKQLIKDDMQPLINLPGTANAKGFVSCKTSMEVSSYLEYPLRTDFKGAQLMLFLPKDIVENSKHNAILASYQPVNLELIYRPKYAVYFPDYQKEPIAFISSLEEELDFTFEKPYCKPIKLKGRYIDHIRDWEIQKTSDNAGYNIGLTFNEQEVRYQINVKFNNLNGQSVKAPYVETWLVPSMGRVITDSNGFCLVLKGKENSSARQITFSSNREDYLILDISSDYSIINVKVEEVFYFDIPSLKKTIERKYHFQPSVYISENGQQWAPFELRTPFKGDKRQYKIKIAGTEEYEETVFSMANKFNSIELNKKPGVKVTILFKGEILQWLEADDRRSVTMQEVNNVDRKFKGQNNTPMKFGVSLSNNALELPAFKDRKKFCFKAPGFKTEYMMLNAHTKELLLDMQPVWWKKIHKLKLTYVFIGILIGFGMGYACHQLMSDTPKDNKSMIIISTENHAENDNSELNVSLTIPSIPAKGAAEPSPQFPQKTEPTAPTQEDDQKLNQQKSAPVQNMSSKMLALMKKLEGLNYTLNDLLKARDMARDEGRLKKNEQFFRDREFALSVATLSKHRSAAFVRRQLGKHPTLTPAQYDAIAAIIAEKEDFNCDMKTYPTLESMLKAYIK